MSTVIEDIKQSVGKMPLNMDYNEQLGVSLGSTVSQFGQSGGTYENYSIQLIVEETSVEHLIRMEMGDSGDDTMLYLGEFTSDLGLSYVEIQLLIRD